MYNPGRQHINADTLSRLPLPETFPAEEEEDLVLMLDGMDDLFSDHRTSKILDN